MAQDNHRVAIDKLFYFLHRFSVKGGEENDSNIFRHTVINTVHTLGIYVGIQWLPVLNSLSVTLQKSKAKKSPDSLYLKDSSISKNYFKFFWQQLLAFQGVIGFFSFGSFGVGFDVRIIWVGKICLVLLEELRTTYLWTSLKLHWFINSNNPPNASLLSVRPSIISLNP